MSLSLMNRINRNNKTGKGDGKNMDRNASVQVKVQQTAQKLLYKICGRKGGAVIVATTAGEIGRIGQKRYGGFLRGIFKKNSRAVKAWRHTEKWRTMTT